MDHLVRETTHTANFHHLSKPLGGFIPPFLLLYSATACSNVLDCLAFLVSHSTLASLINCLIGCEEVGKDILTARRPLMMVSRGACVFSGTLSWAVVLWRLVNPCPFASSAGAVSRGLPARRRCDKVKLIGGVAVHRRELCRYRRDRPVDVGFDAVTQKDEHDQNG